MDYKATETGPNYYVVTEEERAKIDLLDRLISYNCPSRMLDENLKISEYRIELHCMMAIITAKFIKWDATKRLARHEILAVKWETI